MVSTIQEQETKYLIIHVNTIVRLLYAQMWKGENSQNIEKMIEKLYEMVEMDTLTERLKEGNLQKIEKCWNPFNKWLDNCKIYNESKHSRI